MAEGACQIDKPCGLLVPMTTRIAPDLPLYTFDASAATGETITDLKSIGSTLSDIFTPGGPSWVAGVDFGEDFPEGYDPKDYTGQYWIHPHRLTQDDRQMLERMSGWVSEPDLLRSIEVFFP